ADRGWRDARAASAVRRSARARIAAAIGRALRAVGRLYVDAAVTEIAEGSMARTAGTADDRLRSAGTGDGVVIPCTGAGVLTVGIVDAPTSRNRCVLARLGRRVTGVGRARVQVIAVRRCAVAARAAFAVVSLASVAAIDVLAGWLRRVVAARTLDAG